MSMLGMFWFFLWRMTLLGVALEALTYGAYRASWLVLGAFISSSLTSDVSSDGSLAVGLFWVIGTAILFGFFGAVVGVVLGSLCGLLLFAITRVFYWLDPSTSTSYRRVAGLICVSISILMLSRGYYFREPCGGLATRWLHST